MNIEIQDQLRTAIGILQGELSQLKDTHTNLQNRINALTTRLNEYSAAPDSVPLGSGVISQACLLAANAYGVPVNLLYSPARDNRCVFPRQLAMYLARECGLSFPTIAAHFSKDHGTVMHACVQVKERLAVNESFRALTAGYVAQLQASSPFTANHHVPKLTVMK